jgi:hypothetical protein
MVHDEEMDSLLNQLGEVISERGQIIDDWKNNKEKNYDFNKEVFLRLIRLDGWSVDQAMLIMSDVVPGSKYNEIEWADFDYYGDIVRKPNIINAELLSADDSFVFVANNELVKKLSNPCNIQLPFYNHLTFLLSSIDEEKKEKSIDEFLYYLRSGAAVKEEILSQVSKKLFDMKIFWSSNPDHVKDRYPVEYYLRWAERKGIEIPWKNWAIKNDLWPLNIAPQHDIQKQQPGSLSNPQAINSKPSNLSVKQNNLQVNSTTEPPPRPTLDDKTEQQYGKRIDWIWGALFKRNLTGRPHGHPGSLKKEIRAEAIEYFAQKDPLFFTNDAFDAAWKKTPKQA